jgi:prevent-host-death family protein
MPITASKLRENIYRILDEAVETGIPVEVVRKGVVLRIVPEKKGGKLANLKKQRYFAGEPDDFASAWIEGGGYAEWLKEWDKFE